MGFFSKFERLSEKYIEGFFKTRFAENIQPAEIAKLLLREMRDNKSVSVSKTYAPNEYTVLLSKKDWETVEPVKVSLSHELQKYLRQKAFDKGYEMVGEIKVSFAPDESLSLGKISVKSSYSEELPFLAAVTEAAETVKEETIVAAKERFYGIRRDHFSEDTLARVKAGDGRPRAALVQKLGARDGKTFPVGTRGIIIGRRRTNDVALEDTNVSRVHASLDYVEGNYFITDLGSTNGTFVNGSRVNRKQLNESDQIRVGSTILEFRVV